eukprot:11059392-Lingulodinium_polyedra.AAC.1
MAFGVAFFPECNWSTSTCGASACQRRHRPDYDLATVLCRVGVRTMRKLAAQEDREARSVRQLQQKLDRLVSRLP